MTIANREEENSKLSVKTTYGPESPDRSSKLLVAGPQRTILIFGSSTDHYLIGSTRNTRIKKLTEMTNYSQYTVTGNVHNTYGNNATVTGDGNEVNYR